MKKIALYVKEFKQKALKLVNPVSGFFVRQGLSPNWLTTVSFLVCIVSAYFFSIGKLRSGAILFMLGGLFDMVDGQVARASNRVTRFGALYDSTLDRYSEILIFLGITHYYSVNINSDTYLAQLIPFVILLALAGSLMVSYVRARAEAVGYECKSGLMQRPERIVLIVLGALINKYLLISAIFVIAIFANFTAMQRLYLVWSTSDDRHKEPLTQHSDHE